MRWSPPGTVCRPGTASGEYVAQASAIGPLGIAYVNADAIHASRGVDQVNTRLLMMLQVAVQAPYTIGAAPHGTRRTAPLTGGHFEGSRLRGTVVPGSSADWLLLRADGVLELDLRATLRTDDGAFISMRSFGLRHGPPDVIAALGRGESVDPALYYFRTTPRFETAHPKYAFLNHLVTVASGDRRADGPIYTIHEVL